MVGPLLDIGIPTTDIVHTSPAEAERFMYAVALRGGQEWAAVGAVRLPHDHIALIEVAGITDDGEARRQIHELRDRVLAAAAGVRAVPATERVVHSFSTIAAILLLAGLATFGRDDIWHWTIFAGGLLTFATVLIAGIGAYVWAGQTGEQTFAGRLRVLWDNPTALRRSSQILWVPLTIVGVVFWTRNPQELIQPTLYWISLLGGLVLSFLGARHDLLRQLLAWWERRQHPRSVAADPTGWTEVPVDALPDHVSHPGPRTVRAYRHGNEDTWAYIFREPLDPAWARWNEQTYEWDSPRGKVTARTYNVWDRRVETTVEARTSGWTAVVETGEPGPRALELMLGITERLPAPEATERSRPQLTGFLTYSFVPVAAMLIVSTILWVAAFSQLDARFPAILATFRFNALSVVWVPVYLLVMSVLVHVRPELFRFDRKTLKRRARRALRWTMVGTFMNIAFVALWMEKYWTPAFGQVVLWGIPLLLLLVIPILNARMWRGSAK